MIANLRSDERWTTADSSSALDRAERALQRIEQALAEPPAGCRPRRRASRQSARGGRRARRADPRGSRLMATMVDLDDRRADLSGRLPRGRRRQSACCGPAGRRQEPRGARRAWHVERSAPVPVRFAAARRPARRRQAARPPTPLPPPPPARPTRRWSCAPKRSPTASNRWRWRLRMTPRPPKLEATGTTRCEPSENP